MFDIPIPRVFLAGLVLLGPALALAQTPAAPGYGPATPPAQNYPLPTQGYSPTLPGYPLPMQGYSPQMQCFPPSPPYYPAPPGFTGPGAYDFPSPPDFPVPPGMSAPERGMPGRFGEPLRFNQSVTAEGYVLEIPLEGMKAEEIQVDVEGRALRISRDTSAKTTREDSFDEGRGYQRSYSFSSGRASRRVGLPPDADGAAMQRQDSAEQVRILIPRRQGR